MSQLPFFILMPEKIMPKCEL